MFREYVVIGVRRERVKTILAVGAGNECPHGQRLVVLQIDDSLLQRLVIFAFYSALKRAQRWLTSPLYGRQPSVLRRCEQAEKHDADCKWKQAFHGIYFTVPGAGQCPRAH